jgi:hypothetical protein
MQTLTNESDVGRKWPVAALAPEVVEEGESAVEDGAVTTAKIADLAVTTGKIAALGVTTAKIAAGAVTKAKTGMFVSTEQTGTGAAQDVAHGLGGVPSAVFITITELPDAIVAANAGYDIAEGAHDATNVKVTITNTVKFKVMAWL